MNDVSISSHTKSAATQENRSSGFPTWSDTNRPVQSQKRARIMILLVEVEEELYYPSSENKCADQFRSDCEAVMRLCFCIGKKSVFFMTRLKSKHMPEFIFQKCKSNYYLSFRLLL